MMRCPILPAILLTALIAATPSAAITPMSPLRCTVVRAVNGSTGEPTGLEGGTTLLSPAELKVDGAWFTARRTTHDHHLTETIDYRIARAGLAFEATAMRRHDDLGEEHLIRLTGTCTHAAP